MAIKTEVLNLRGESSYHKKNALFEISIQIIARPHPMDAMINDINALYCNFTWVSMRWEVIKITQVKNVVKYVNPMSTLTATVQTKALAYWRLQF